MDAIVKLIFSRTVGNPLSCTFQTFNIFSFNFVISILTIFFNNRVTTFLTHLNINIHITVLRTFFFISTEFNNHQFIFVSSNQMFVRLEFSFIIVFNFDIHIFQTYFLRNNIIFVFNFFIIFFLSTCLTIFLFELPFNSVELLQAFFIPLVVVMV